MMRIAAYTLLFLMVVDLGADFVYGESGDLSFSIKVSTKTAATIDFRGAPTNDPPTTNHECFCCCTHLEQGLSQIVHVEMISSQELVSLSLVLPDPDPIRIYHPPLQFS